MDANTKREGKTMRRGGWNQTGDPRWLTARFGQCARCGTQLTGKKAFYFPRGKQCFCEAEDCGGKESASFEGARFDEAAMTGEW